MFRGGRIIGLLCLVLLAVARPGLGNLPNDVEHNPDDWEKWVTGDPAKGKTTETIEEGPADPSPKKLNERVDTWGRQDDANKKSIKTIKNLKIQDGNLPTGPALDEAIKDLRASKGIADSRFGINYAEAAGLIQDLDLDPLIGAALLERLQKQTVEDWAKDYKDISDAPGKLTAMVKLLQQEEKPNDPSENNLKKVQEILKDLFKDDFDKMHGLVGKASLAGLNRDKLGKLTDWINDEKIKKDQATAEQQRQVKADSDFFKDVKKDNPTDTDKAALRTLRNASSLPADQAKALESIQNLNPSLSGAQVADKLRKAGVELSQEVGAELGHRLAPDVLKDLPAKQSEAQAAYTDLLSAKSPQIAREKARNLAQAVGSEKAAEILSGLPSPEMSLAADVLNSEKDRQKAAEEEFAQARMKFTTDPLSDPKKRQDAVQAYAKFQSSDQKNPDARKKAVTDLSAALGGADNLKTFADGLPPGTGNKADLQAAATLVGLSKDAEHGPSLEALSRLRLAQTNEELAAAAQNLAKDLDVEKLIHKNDEQFASDLGPLGLNDEQKKALRFAIQERAGANPDPNPGPPKPRGEAPAPAPPPRRPKAIRKEFRPSLGRGNPAYRPECCSSQGAISEGL